MYHHSHQSRKLQGVEVSCHLSVLIAAHTLRTTFLKSSTFIPFDADHWRHRIPDNWKSAFFITAFILHWKAQSGEGENPWIKKCTLTKRIYIKELIRVDFFKSILYVQAMFLSLSLCLPGVDLLCMKDYLLIHKWGFHNIPLPLHPVYVILRVAGCCSLLFKKP